MSTTITIPKHITHGDELVIIRRKEYEDMHKHLKEIEGVLTKIARGEKELREGKIKPIQSLSDLDK